MHRLRLNSTQAEARPMPTCLGLKLYKWGGDDAVRFLRLYREIGPVQSKTMFLKQGTIVFECNIFTI